MKLTNKELDSLYEHLFNLGLSDNARRFIENTDPQIIPNLFPISSTADYVEDLVNTLEGNTVE